MAGANHNTVLVTGATGLIGRHLVEKLVHAEHRVRAFVRPQTSAPSLDRLGVEVVRGDITDANAVEQAVVDCQLVFHLAAAHETTGMLTKKDVLAANVRGTENVARAAMRAGVKRLVFTSTSCVCGRAVRDPKVDENTKTRPDSPYCASKLQGEQVLLSLYKKNALPVVIARLSAVWGPGTTGWLGLFRSIAAGNFRLFGDGSNYHQYADVADIVEALLLCGSVPGIEGRTYLLSGPEPVQLRDLVKMIGEETGAPALRPNLPIAPLYVYRTLDRVATALFGRRLPRADRLAIFLGNRCLDLSRARNELGYAPKFTTRQIVHRLADWFRSQGYLPRLHAVE